MQIYYADKINEMNYRQSLLVWRNIALRQYFITIYETILYLTHLNKLFI